MNDKILHTVQLGMVLLVAVVLILVGHAYVAPDIVFTSLVAGVGGLVGSRIASNGYTSTAPGATSSAQPPVTP